MRGDFRKSLITICITQYDDADYYIGDFVKATEQGFGHMRIPRPMSLMELEEYSKTVTDFDVIIGWAHAIDDPFEIGNWGKGGTRRIARILRILDGPFDFFINENN